MTKNEQRKPSACVGDRGWGALKMKKIGGEGGGEQIACMSSFWEREHLLGGKTRKSKNKHGML
jgi:hypothetical protein